MTYYSLYFNLCGSNKNSRVRLKFEYVFQYFIRDYKFVTHKLL